MTAPVAISMTSAVLSFLATASHPLGAWSLVVTMSPSPDWPARQHPLAIPRARSPVPHLAFIVKVSFEPSADRPAASATRTTPSSSLTMSRSRLSGASSSMFAGARSIRCAERESVDARPEQWWEAGVGGGGGSRAAAKFHRGLHSCGWKWFHTVAHTRAHSPWTTAFTRSAATGTCASTAPRGWVRSACDARRRRYPRRTVPKAAAATAPPSKTSSLTPNPGRRPAHAQRTLTPQRQRLNTTRARHARSLAGILRDPAAGPDVARQWGHVVVACVVDALAVWEDEDAEVASLLLDAALAVSTAASASDAGATLDACVSRAVMHLSSRDTARGRGGGPPAAFNQPRHHLPPPNSLHNSGASSQPSQEHFYIAPPRGSQGYNSQPGGAVGSSWDSTWERGGALVPTTAAPPPAATGGGGPGWDSSSFGVAPLTSTQPRVQRRPRAHEDAGRARLLRLIAELLALDVPHGSLPTVFLPNPVEQRGWTGGGAVGFSQPADSQSQGWYGGTPPGQHPSSSYRGQAIATSTSTSALALVIDALGDGSASKETRLAALSVCSQLANRAPAFPSLLASDPGAGDAMAAGALGSVLVCARSSGAATDADAGAVAEALLVVASVANADREFNPEKLLTACPPGVSITKVPTFVQVVNESLLSPRLALRADACDCLAVVVAASSSSVASVESILRHEVAEHVFELLRDVSRARAAEEGIDRDGRARPRHTRGFPAGVPPRADRDVAARTALAALAALAGCAPRVFNPRLVHGADPVAAVLTKAVSDRDWEVTLAGAELLRSVAAGEDPGNVPEESLGALVASLADACEHGRGYRGCRVERGWPGGGRRAWDFIAAVGRRGRERGRRVARVQGVRGGRRA